MSLFTKWSFKNKAAISLITVLVLLVGVVSYFKLPMGFLTAAGQSQVTFVAMGQEGDSNSMEQQIITPIMGAVKGKKDVFSTTGDGFSKIDIFFESKTNMKEVKQKVLATVPLPNNVQKSSIVQLNTSMIPIAQVSIPLKDGLTRSNSEFAIKKIIPMYKEIKGVANVQIFDQESSYVSLEIENKLLTEKQLSLKPISKVAKKGGNSYLRITAKVVLKNYLRYMQRLQKRYLVRETKNA